MYLACTSQLATNLLCCTPEASCTNNAISFSSGEDVGAVEVTVTGTSARVEGLLAGTTGSGAMLRVGAGTTRRLPNTAPPYPVIPELLAVDCAEVVSMSTGRREVSEPRRRGLPIAGWGAEEDTVAEGGGGTRAGVRGLRYL